MGLFAIGMSALGKSLGFELKGFIDSPGPHRMKAWNPVGGMFACGMAKVRRLSSLLLEEEPLHRE